MVNGLDDKVKPEDLFNLFGTCGQGESLGPNFPTAKSIPPRSIYLLFPQKTHGTKKTIKIRKIIDSKMEIFVFIFETQLATIFLTNVLGSARFIFCV